MSRAVCGVCFCPYGDEGDCACTTQTHYKKVIDDVQALFDAKRKQPAQQRPQNCGTGYCSCIECLFEQPAQQELLQEIARLHDRIKDLQLDVEFLSQPAQQEPIRVPVTDNTYGYAKSLAEAIFKQHFASDEHYASGRIVWEVSDTVIGILTQIDNMVADMVRRPAQQQGPAAIYVGETWCGSVVRLYENLPLETPLYTSPPSHAQTIKDQETVIHRLQKRYAELEAKVSKPWVGLTDEEFQMIYDMSRTSAEMMEMVETKLQEKNT